MSWILSIKMSPFYSLVLLVYWGFLFDFFLFKKKIYGISSSATHRLIWPKFYIVWRFLHLSIQKQLLRSFLKQPKFQIKFFCLREEGKGSSSKFLNYVLKLKKKKKPRPQQQLVPFTQICSSCSLGHLSSTVLKARSKMLVLNICLVISICPFARY